MGLVPKVPKVPKMPKVPKVPKMPKEANMQNDAKKPKRQTNRHKQAAFSSVADIQAFIVWAREQGLKRAKIGDVEFEIADFTIALDSESKALRGTEERDTSKTLTDTLKPDAQQEDDDLFWSSS